MNNSINKKLSEVLGKMDDKVTQAKLNAMLDMLKNGNTDELAKKIGKVDKNELLSKINEFDDARLKELNLSKDDLKQRVSNADLNNLQKMLGEHGDEIVQKIKEIIK
ncbi:MAG TPA: membrane trafficking protein [Ruminiclostridium sp.]|nr:membrane trafficking protein [Ruminiclostridium sp.]